MHLPFKTEHDLLARLSSLSELVRFDYRRRLEGGTVAVLAAYLEKELAQTAELHVAACRAQVVKVNALMAILVLLLSTIYMTGITPLAQSAAWFLSCSWISYFVVTTFLVIPQLASKQIAHWSAYQKYACEWETLLGNRGFAEHMLVRGQQFKGESPENADVVNLAIRGYALLQAEQHFKG